MIGVIPERRPEGWPVRCLACESWSFMYVSDRSGNYRLYNCKACKRRYVAKWTGERVSSCIGEPQNTSMNQWLWVEVIEDNLIGERVIDVKHTIVTEEFRDGSPALELEVARKRIGNEIADDGLIHQADGWDTVYCGKDPNLVFNSDNPIRTVTCVACLREAMKKRGYAHMREWIESRILELS